MTEKIIVWKHHIAINFEENGTPVENNGVGIGGTIFRDFDNMKEWLEKNDGRRFYVAPIKLTEDDLMPTDGGVDNLMANTNKSVHAIGRFAPVEYWEKHRDELV